MPNTVKIQSTEMATPDDPPPDARGVPTLPGFDPGLSAAPSSQPAVRASANSPAPPIDKNQRPAAFRFQEFTPPEVGMPGLRGDVPDGDATQPVQMVVVPGWTPRWLRALIRNRRVLFALTAAVFLSMVTVAGMRHYARRKHQQAAEQALHASATPMVSSVPPIASQLADDAVPAPGDSSLHVGAPVEVVVPKPDRPTGAPVPSTPATRTPRLPVRKPAQPAPAPADESSRTPSLLVDKPNVY